MKYRVKIHRILKTKVLDVEADGLDVAKKIALEKVNPKFLNPKYRYGVEAHEYPPEDITNDG